MYLQTILKSAASLRIWQVPRLRKNYLYRQYSSPILSCQCQKNQFCANSSNSTNDSTRKGQQHQFLCHKYYCHSRKACA